MIIKNKRKATWQELADRVDELQEKLNNSISKDKIKDCLEDIEDYFENVSVPKEDIEFIKEKRKDLLKEE